jgi:hypothetical protein
VYSREGVGGASAYGRGGMAEASWYSAGCEYFSFDDESAAAVAAATSPIPARVPHPV